MQSTPDIQDIIDKVESGQRLNAEDALALFEHPDLLEIGVAANRLNFRKNGRQVFFNSNRHINPTNVCAKSCKFCAFSRKPGEEGAYEYSIEQILTKAGEVVEEGATEVHMVGGLHPRWSFQHFLTILRELKRAYPNLHIKAFTAVEIDWLSQKARLNIRETLIALKEAGLDSMPGGGAEIFHPEIRAKICDTKTDADRWIDIHRTAHSLNIPTNCTMLYGHIENYSHRVHHMQRLRELQDETGGFNVFIPLAFQPYDNDMGITRYTAGTDDLRTIAVARLFLDNFKHIKAYWIMLGQDIAQVALNFGANDLDGTVTEEKISRMAGGRSGMAMAKSEIKMIIRKAKRVPVERDTLYRAIDQEIPRSARNDEARVRHPEAKPKDLPISTNILLYKAEKGEWLDAAEAEILAHSASLAKLGRCADSIKESKLATKSGGILLNLSHPISENLATLNDIQVAIDSLFNPSLQAEGIHNKQAIVPLDLGSPSFRKDMPSLANICAFVEQLKARQPHVSVAVLGFKSLWALAQNWELSLPQLLCKLAKSGVDTIESSAYEGEDDLTLTEIMDLHRVCHQLNIRTVAKVEIVAPLSGNNHPFWETFIKKTIEFRNLQTETKGLLALKVEPGKDSFVTPVEYLRGISLARILASNIDHILAPIGKIPSIKQKDLIFGGTRSASFYDEGILKIAPLAIHFGASDLGGVPLGVANPLQIFDELKVSGIQPHFRDVQFANLNLL